MAKAILSRTQALRDALEDDIIHGRYTPGQRLDEVRLAERFNVSRTPIREALQQLAAVGLVEAASKRGMVVADVGLPQLVEMFEVMAELEGMCARLAARRITQDEAKALEDSLKACDEAAQHGDSDAYYYENQRFHELIYKASHNGFLVQQTRQLQTRLKPYRRLQLRVRNRLTRSLQEHRQIVDAILSGDETLAERSIKDHITIQGERFGDLVASVRVASSN